MNANAVAQAVGFSNLYEYALIGGGAALLAVMLAVLAPETHWIRKLVFPTACKLGKPKRVMLYVTAGALAATLLRVSYPEVGYSFTIAVGFAPTAILGYFLPPGPTS